MIPSSFFNVMALTVAAVALLSCGQDPSPAVQGTSLEPGNYCEAFFEPFCERQIGCNFALINQATSIEACLSEASRLCSPQLETYLDSLEVGNTTFDVDALSACRQEVKAANCRQLAAGLMPEACLKIFVGAAELGGECFTDVECVSGTICASAGRCPGLCEVPNTPAEVFNCELGGCAESQSCVDGVCIDPLGVGELCPNDDRACQGDLFCGKEAQDPELKCRQPRPEGGACSFRTHCQAGLSCQIVGADVGNRTCELALVEGGDCFDSQECAVGLVCEAGEGTCVKLRQEEEQCFDVNDCDEGLYCWDEFVPEPLVGICRENAKVGVGVSQPCNPSVDRCRLGLYCRIGEVPGLGECAVLPDIGEVCADFSRNLNEECRTGECILANGEHRCIIRGSGGDPCTINDECLSTSCREGICADFEDVFCSVGRSD